MKLEDLTPKQRLKAEKWLAIIRECINSDLSNEEWCEQNNVSIKSYYYYLAKLRK
ncbi:IS66 family insertion sequence element accessory protein TnpA, partial [Holdemanella porci]